MSSVGFEPAVSARERPQTYVLDRTAIWIGMVFSMSLLLISFICNLFEGQEKEIWYSLRTKLQCQHMTCFSINKISDPFKKVNFTLVITVLVIVQSLRLRDQGRFGTWNCSFPQVKLVNQWIYFDESFRNSISAVNSAFHTLWDF